MINEPQKSKDATLTAFRDMEHEIASLSSMTIILGELLDEHLKDNGIDSAPNMHKIWLTDRQMELLCFAWNDVIARARAVERSFYAAGEGNKLVVVEKPVEARV